MIHPDDVPDVVESPDVIYVKLSNGKVYREHLSQLVTIVDSETDNQTQIKLVLSHICPVNLLGRDVLTKLGIAVLPCDNGLVAKRIPKTTDIIVLQNVIPPHYWYSLDLVDTGPASVGLSLISKGKSRAPPVADLMRSTELHCTMYYKIHHMTQS